MISPVVTGHRLKNKIDGCCNLFDRIAPFKKIFPAKDLFIS
jgi:hypothetical protein